MAAWEATSAAGIERLDDKTDFERISSQTPETSDRVK